MTPPNASKTEILGQCRLRPFAYLLLWVCLALSPQLNASQVFTIGSIGNHSSPEYNPGDGRWWTMTTAGFDQMGSIDAAGSFQVEDSVFGGGGPTRTPCRCCTAEARKV